MRLIYIAPIVVGCIAGIALIIGVSYWIYLQFTTISKEEAAEIEKHHHEHPHEHDPPPPPHHHHIPDHEHHPNYHRIIVTPHRPESEEEMHNNRVSHASETVHHHDITLDEKEG